MAMRNRHVVVNTDPGPSSDPAAQLRNLCISFSDRTISFSHLKRLYMLALKGIP